MENASLEFSITRLHKINNGNALKAFVDISVNDALLIKGLRIIDGKNGIFVSMPQELAKDNKWYDTVRCLNDEIKEQISQEVLSAYNAQNMICEN